MPSRTPHVSILPLTAAESGGLTIAYTIADTPFGPVLIASTDTGVCVLSFVLNQADAIAELRRLYPNSSVTAATTAHHTAALQAISGYPVSVKLHLHATPFQLTVWQALLRIPRGSTTTYSHIARQIGRPTATRAVANAIGRNPVAILIPCHRVVRADGTIGGYRWPLTLKLSLLRSESLIRR